MDNYYTEKELWEIPMLDMEALKEYLYGWDDAIVTTESGERLFKKEYVDIFINR